MMEVTMRERKKEATKAKILKTAISLINKNGFAETTMHMIAQKADVALRTLYNYFPSKESIVATYIRNVVEDEQEKHWRDLLDLDTTYERLLMICEVSAEWAEKNYILMEIYAADPRNYRYAATEDIPLSGLDDIVTLVMQMGQKTGDVINSVSAEVLTRWFMGFYYMGILTWLGGPEQDLFTIYREGLDLFYRGIKPDGTDAGMVMWGMLY